MVADPSTVPFIVVSSDKTMRMPHEIGIAEFVGLTDICVPPGRAIPSSKDAVIVTDCLKEHFNKNDPVNPRALLVTVPVIDFSAAVKFTVGVHSNAMSEELFAFI